MRRTAALLRYAWRRIASRLGVSLAVWAGLALAVALVVSIPIYAEATGYRILLAALQANSADDPLPPFGMVYRYEGSSGQPITWAQYGRINSVAGDLSGVGIQTPSTREVRYAATATMRMVAQGADPNSFDETPQARLAFVTDIEQNIQLSEGEMPRPYSGSGPMDVLVSERDAATNTYLVDDLYTMHSSFGSAIDLNLPVRVAGVWRPSNPNSDYWFYSPGTFGSMALLPEASFAAAVNSDVPWVSYMAWYTALDHRSVRSADVAPLREQIAAASAAIQRLLPGVELSRSPLEALQQHADQVRLLTVTLALFAVPLLGLVWLFVVQVARMLVESQRQEMALLRSRGSSRLQVVGLAVLEGVLLSVAAVLAGLGLGLATAQGMVWTQSFLQFVPRPGPPVELLSNSWMLGALVVGLGLPAVILPALGNSRYTIVSFKQERSRSTRKPLWKRSYLDLGLLAVALYGYRQLRLQGSIPLPGVSTPSEDPWRNPVVLLAPALLVFALALFLLRLLPVGIAVLDRVFRRSRGTSLLTLRYLARDAGTYSGPVLLIALTLSLAAFTSSMARTLDEQTSARARYGSGADVRLVYQPRLQDASGGGSDEPILNTGPVDTNALPPEAPEGESLEQVAIASTIDYLLVPVDSYLDVEGVRAATRVAPSDVYIAGVAGGQEQATFLGVDRTQLASVIGESWDPTFAGEPLGAMLNRLAADPSAALVSKEYMLENDVKIGDRVDLRLNDRGETITVPFRVAGSLDYFPTLYPESGPFVIGNLDYSIEQQGGPYPFQIWLKMKSGSNLEGVQGEAYGQSLAIMEGTPRELINADMARPERQGLLGLLTVGFLGAAIVTVVGYLAHTIVSFRRRLVEMGILRAMGLSNRQLASLLIWEQVLVVGSGGLSGAGLGVLASRMFVPFLRVRSGEHPNTPPFVVEIAWDQIAMICAVTGGMLVLTVGIILLLLRSMRIFEAVKLGETV